jgi:hypothetical protein
MHGAGMRDQDVGDEQSALPSVLDRLVAAGLSREHIQQPLPERRVHVHRNRSVARHALAPVVH